MAEVKKLGKPSLAEQAKGGFGKKRSLDDIDDFVFERSPMKKFGKDLVTNLAQNAPGYAKQYSQSQESKARNSQPRFAQVYVSSSPISTQSLTSCSVFNRPSSKPRAALRALLRPRFLPAASGTL
jgi:hypothetical protein